MPKLNFLTIEKRFVCEHLYGLTQWFFFILQDAENLKDIDVSKIRTNLDFRHLLKFEFKTHTVSNIQDRSKARSKQSSTDPSLLKHITWSSIGHAEDSGPGVLQLEVFVGEFGAVDGLAASAVVVRKVATLSKVIVHGLKQQI